MTPVDHQKASDWRDTAERLFNHTGFTIVWVAFLGALFGFVGMSLARMLVVCWLRGSDAYFRRGIRIPKGKHPLHFTDGGIVPELPYFLAVLLMFFVVAGGLSLLLIFSVRFYERHFQSKKIHDA